jgi:hypothetical protein
MSNIPYLTQLDDNSSVTAKDLSAMAAAVVSASTPSVPTSTYKSYVALLTQSGAAAPVATVIENTTGQTFAWTRNFTGAYTVTASSPILLAGKTAGYFINNMDGIMIVWSFKRTSTTAFTLINIANLPAGGGLVTETQVDNVLSSSLVEIRVYN